ncbi:MAG: aromatic amino acid hydroxylase, partial [Bdellovibrionales bacterium]|nr:aromatic amino acid hydroxylase [Bdellovibrionales bacterium]
ISEAAYLSRMNWWTAEYGLIGPLDDPKIFGAGLLSSIGESRLCLGDKVKKLPLSIKCLEYNYDITEPQPQLFVADTFDRLTEVLEELANSMAFSRGGLYGLEKALESETVNTIELNSGLQISGVLEFFYNEGDEISFIKLKGGSQISFNSSQLDGHGVEYHSHGYSSPIGRLKDGTELSNLSLSELKEYGVCHGAEVNFEYASGIKLTGKVEKIITKKQNPILISFKNCKITLNDKILFDPSWGNFDLALGEQVVSVFGGAADRENFELQDDYTPQFIPPKIYNETEQTKHSFYKRIREARENSFDKNSLKNIYENYLELYSDQWLMAVEIYELAVDHNLDDLQKDIKKHLTSLKEKKPETAMLIDDGIKVAEL